MAESCIPDSFSALDPYAMVMLDLGDMDLFGEYLTDMEGFLENHLQEHSEQYETLRSKLQSDRTAVSPDDQVPREILVEEMWLYRFEGFANILRKSFFISVYGWLESSLTEECHRRDSEWKARIKEKGIRGSTIYEAMSYLTRCQGVNYPLGESAEWRRINGDYRRLRDCIVHCGGRLDERCEGKTKLERYARKAGLTSSYGDEIILSADFCREALDTVTRFYTSLLLACGRVSMSRPDGK